MRRNHRALLALRPFTFLTAACDGDVTAPATGVDAPAFGASASSISDDFTTWQAGLWSAEEQPLGKGWFRAANVSVAGGILRLTSPAGTM